MLMATIEKRNGKYRVKVRLKGVTKSETFTLKSDAVAWAARTEAAILDGVQGNAPKSLYFADLLTRYRDEITPTKRGNRTETYRLNRALRSDLADIKVSDLRPHHFAQWRDSRKKEVQEATVRRELETLSAVCQMAVKEWGLLPSNPLLQIRRPAKGRARNYIPPDDIVLAVVRELGVADGVPIITTKQRIGLVVLFAIETAMRAGEICNMMWRDVHLSRRVVHLPMTKNGSSRDVPLSKKAMAILDRLPRSESGSVFDVSSHTLDVMFRRARAKVDGAEGFHFHDTRHKALTRMAARVEPMQLAKISGHKDLRILLNVYYNPDVGELADLLD